MVHHQGICSSKQRSRNSLGVEGYGGEVKGGRENIYGGPQHEEEMVTTLSDHGLEDVTSHFTPRRWYRGRGQWSQGGTSGDGDRGLHPWNSMGILQERGALGAQSPHLPQDDGIGDPRRRGGVQQEIPTGENPAAHPYNHMQATTR